jgi:hypothetical protein
VTITAEAVTGQPFSFKRFREVLATMGLQEGVYAPGDFLVRQRAAGANMSVEVDPGDALVTIDSGVRNGAAHVMSDAVENPAVGASHATLPRIDSVVLQYNDTGIPAGVGGNTPTVRVVAGTATAGATLDNRNGAPGGPGGPVMPNDALLLRDLLIPAASTSVTTANIRDRRKWARGARVSITDNAGDRALGTFTGSVAQAVMGPRRIETGGGRLRVTCTGLVSHSPTAAGQLIQSDVYIDGAQSSYNEWRLAAQQAAVSYSAGYNPIFDVLPAAGSHVLYVLMGLGGVGGAQNGSFVASGGNTALWEIAEDIRPSADNGTS